MPRKFASEAVTYVGNHWTNILLSSLQAMSVTYISVLRSPAPAFLFWWTVLLSGICIQIISALLFWFIVPQKDSQLQSHYSSVPAPCFHINIWTKLSTSEMKLSICRNSNLYYFSCYWDLCSDLNISTLKLHLIITSLLHIYLNDG